MVNRSVFLKKQALDAELGKLDPPSALVRVDSRLATESDAEFVFEMKVTKAKLLSSLGRKNEAIVLLTECSRYPVADESAAYFAAEILVEEGRFREAIELLEMAEGDIKRSGSIYYKNCIYLLHAYCEFKKTQPERAKHLLAEVNDEDEALFWLRVEPVISVKKMREWLILEGPR